MANDKKETKNPFALLKKSSREEAAKNATKSLNDKIAADNAAPDTNAVQEPLPTENNASPELTSIPTTELKQEFSGNSLGDSEMLPNNEVGQEGSPVLASNSSKPTQEQASVSNQSGPTKERKKPGRKKKYVEDNAPSTVVRVSSRNNHILNLIGSIEKKTHNEVIDELLKNHPLYAKIKTLL